jgi:SAM-dependent methyltransferase
MAKSANLLLRKFVPSLAKLSYNPVFATLLRVSDIVPGKFFREFKRLPPNHMRVRVGVGNQLFANQVRYLTAGYGMWMFAMSKGYVSFDSAIVEIGCGIGRRTHIMRDYHFEGVTYTGNYLGIDVDKDMIDWCKKNFDERFEFVLSSHATDTYQSAEAAKDTYYTIPRDDNSVNFVFSTSLVTHLLEFEVRNYFKEAARILKPGSAMMMSVFAIDKNPPRLGERYTFSHRIGPAYVESMKVPEAAVAYQSDWLIEVAKECGFSHAEVMASSKDVQQMLVAIV